MQCPKCGWQNPDDATRCSNCFTDIVPAAPQQPEPTPQQPQQPYGQQPQQPYGQQPYGQPPYAPGMIQNIPDYLVASIIITAISLFCCGCIPVSLAFGIVAIVKSVNANKLKTSGDYIGALRDANAAKTWLYWAVGLDIVGLIVNIIYFIVIVAGGGKHFPGSGTF